MYADRETAPVSERTKAALRLVEKMTLRPEDLSPGDIVELRQAGVTEKAIVDAATISALFNVIDRLADSFNFRVPDQAAFDRAAISMVKRGYALPGPIFWLTRD